MADSGITEVDVETNRQTIRVPVERLRALADKLHAVDSAASVLAKIEDGIKSGTAIRFTKDEKPLVLAALWNWRPGDIGLELWRLRNALVDE